MRYIEHDCTDEIVCPHCGYEYSDSFEWDEYGNEICCECGKPFSYARNVSVTYGTDKLEFEECPICGEEKAILDDFHSSLGRIETRMCKACLGKEKEKLIKKYLDGLKKSNM